jgi:hypothetical protein
METRRGNGQRQDEVGVLGTSPQQFELPDPRSVRGTLCCFRSEVGFGYASANSFAPAAQRNYPIRTLIIPGTENRGTPLRLTKGDEGWRSDGTDVAQNPC